MRSPLAVAIGHVLLSTILLVAAVEARPVSEELPPQVLPAERPLQAVLDAAMGRIVVNHARGVRIERVSMGPPFRFTLVNTGRRKQQVRIGILHLRKGDYDVHTQSMTGQSRHPGLNSSHLAAGWRFLLAPPQTESQFGKAVRRLAEGVRKTQLLLADRPKPEVTKALTPLAAAVRRAESELAATRRVEVAIVPAGTREALLPPRGSALSEVEMERRWAELDRLRRELIAAANGSGDSALANRIRRWFRIRVQ